jgi:hypothetical protein
VKKSLHTISLQFAHQVQHSSLIPGQSLYSNCCIKIKQNSEESDDPQNDPMFTPDTLSTELEKAINASFSEGRVSSIKKRRLSNEQKTALGKQKSQQASSAAKDKLKKKNTVYHTKSRRLEDLKI